MTTCTKCGYPLPPTGRATWLPWWERVKSPNQTGRMIHRLLAAPHLGFAGHIGTVEKPGKRWLAWCQMDGLRLVGSFAFLTEARRALRCHVSDAECEGRHLCVPEGRGEK